MHNALRWSSRLVRLVVPLWCIRVLTAGRGRGRWRGAVGLAAVWTYAYRSYRRRSIVETARERELLATATLEAYRRHYNERVPTIEEEFDIWGEYHQHRHEMRYDLVADTVREHLPPGG